MDRPKKKRMVWVFF